MTTSSEPNPEQTELPTIPTIRVMRTWNMEKVRQWVQQRDPALLRGNNLENFTKADIGGRAFLFFSVEDFKTCDLSLAVAAALKDLADEVKEENKLSNQTATRKRNEDEIDASEPFISPKRNQQEDLSSKLATEARGRRKRIEEIITDPPHHLRLSRSWSPPVKRSRAPLPPQEDAFIDNAHVMSQWKEFYTRARAIRDKGLEEPAEPVDLFNASHTTLNAIDETFEKIEKEESYNFPKDGDPTLQAACEALSHALQKASRAKVEHDTPEVAQALDNLRTTYDEAAKSNTVSMHYIDTEPPYTPFSPLEPDASLERILLARSWVKELITKICNNSLGRRILIVGRPGSGKSVTLIGYLLFYFIALGARVILQMKSDSRLGIIFDDNGVRGIYSRDAFDYSDGKPCYQLVSADGPQTSPLPKLGFCTATIVVTSPNLKTKLELKAWQKQAKAYHFISPPPSCPEVVYLFSKVWLYDSYLVYWMYQEWVRDFRLCQRDCQNANGHIKNGTFVRWHEEKTQSIKSHARSMLAGDPSGGQQLPDDETNMTIPSDLVTMERRNGSIYKYKITLMTERIADIVFNVQEEADWKFNWRVLNMYFSNPETRVAAGKKFEKMFLQKFQKDLSKMPPCFKMVNTNGTHPLSLLNEEAVMPWEGLDRQPTLEYISIGKDADGSLYSKKELRAVMVAAMDNDSPPIRFLTPCAQNWATWDAAVIRYTEEHGKRAVHVIFLQTTINIEHDIYAKGLNQVRDAIPAEWKCDGGLDVYYHYVLVLFVDERSTVQIPKWRHVLVSSTDRKKDSSWSPDDLRQYVMFVTKKELFNRD